MTCFENWLYYADWCRKHKHFFFAKAQSEKKEKKRKAGSTQAVKSGLGDW